MSTSTNNNNPTFSHSQLIFTEEFTEEDHDPLRTLSYLSQNFNESSLTFIIELNRSLEDQEPHSGLGSRRRRSRETEPWRLREVDDGEGKKVWLNNVCIVVLFHCFLASQEKLGWEWMRGGVFGTPAA
jgi:hypothetical protein